LLPNHKNLGILELSQCSTENCLSKESGRFFGDYQYFLSFGGDQYFDLPLAIDAIYGTRGLIVQVGHCLSQVSYEVTGYAAIGKLENTFVIMTTFEHTLCLLDIRLNWAVKMLIFWLHGQK
jgi:hypothetical protein